MKENVLWIVLLLSAAGVVPLVCMFFAGKRDEKRRQLLDAEQKRRQADWDAYLVRLAEETERRSARLLAKAGIRPLKHEPVLRARSFAPPALSPRRTSNPAPATASTSDDWVIPASLAFAHSRDDSPAPAPAPSFSSGGGGGYSGGGASGSWDDSSSSSSSSSSCSSSDSSSSSSSCSSD